MSFFPVYLVRAEDELIALHLAIELSKQVPTALWRPGGPEGVFNMLTVAETVDKLSKTAMNKLNPFASAFNNPISNGLTVIDADDLWQAALKARRHSLVLVYAGDDGPADYVVKGSTGCRTYGIYRNLFKAVEKTVDDIAVKALEWRQGEAQINVKRKEGELPELFVVIPRGIDIKKLTEKLKPYKPIVHRDLTRGFIDEIMPRIKREWPKRGVVIAPNEAGAPGGIPIYVNKQNFETIDKEIKEIISNSPCVFNEYEEPDEFKPEGKPSPLPMEWINKLAQGITCKYTSICTVAIQRWPRLAYYLRRYHEPDKLAALAIWNEGQLIEVLKALAADEEEVDVPDYTDLVLTILFRGGTIEAQTHASPPRKPPFVGIFGYTSVKIMLLILAVISFLFMDETYGLSLALPAIYMLLWPDVILAMLYSLNLGMSIEPRLYYIGNGVYRDVFGRTHVIYRASPLRNALTMSASSAYNEYRTFISSLPLSPGDILEFRYTRDRMYIRYTGNKWHEIRGFLERYFVLFEPAVITQSPLPYRHIRLLNIYFMVLGLFGMLTLLGYNTTGLLIYPLVTWVLKRRARAYAAAAPMYSLFHYELFTSNAHKDPESLHKIAKDVASDMTEWSVIIRREPKIERKFESKFKRSYNSIFDTATRLINILIYQNAVERIRTYGEQGIRVQFLTSKPANHGLVTVTEPYGAFERWMMWSAKRGLSGDLTAFPVFGDVKYSGKAIWMGRDPQGRDIYIFPDVMPAMHALIFGKTGMGKSWSVATLLIRLRQAGYNVHFTIVDPHGDYIRLRDLLDANVVVVGKKDYIDIFSDADEKTNKLAAKLTYEELNEPMNLDQIRDYYANLLVGKGVPISRSKNYIIAFAEKARNDSSFMYIYGSLLVRQLYRHAFDVIREGTKDVWVIVLDEAYLFLNDRVLRNLMLGARKFGVGIWLVVHETSLLSEAVMSSTYLKIILGGENVPEMLRGLIELSKEEADWLHNARPPHELDGRAQALIIHGPSNVRYIGYIELDKRVKRR